MLRKESVKGKWRGIDVVVLKHVNIFFSFYLARPPSYKIHLETNSKTWLVKYPIR